MKKKKISAGITAKFQGETRGRGERERGVREKSEENGDGGGQMARDEREREAVKEGERSRNKEEWKMRKL